MHCLCRLFNILIVSNSSIMQTLLASWVVICRKDLEEDLLMLCSSHVVNLPFKFCAYTHRPKCSQPWLEKLLLLVGSTKLMGRCILDQVLRIKDSVLSSKWDVHTNPITTRAQEQRGRHECQSWRMGGYVTTS